MDAKPRKIESRICSPPVLIFSDGACEESGTSVGAVLYDPISDLLECFGAVVSKETTQAWKTREDQRQVIGQAELFPLLVSRLTWPEILKGRRTIYFLDNESARIAMVRAYGPVLCSLSIVMSCSKWDYDNESLGWYARVLQHPTLATHLRECSCHACAGLRRSLPQFTQRVTKRMLFSELGDMRIRSDRIIHQKHMHACIACTMKAG